MTQTSPATDDTTTGNHTAPSPLTPLPAVPDGYVLRGTTHDDLDAIFELIDTADMHDVGARDYGREELDHQFSAPGVDPARDLFLVTLADGTAAGFLGIETRAGSRLDCAGWVHPAHRGRSLGTLLIASAERRGQERFAELEAGTERSFANWIHHSMDGAHALLGGNGYRHSRSMWQMVRDLGDEPYDAAWPDGIELRPFEPEAHGRQVHEAVSEAFRDHWGHTPSSFERWYQRRIARPSFDASLWLVAWQGDEIAGASLNDREDGEYWVSTLGVRRPWRRHGLAMALLQRSFAEFRSRGGEQAKLVVDSENLTGATRLYERAGMRISRQYDRYEKVLPPR